ncbi:MAG: c-type cytochrome [Pseudobdellovibrionaceae bacterium]
MKKNNVTISAGVFLLFLLIVSLYNFESQNSKLKNYNSQSSNKFRQPTSAESTDRQFFIKGPGINKTFSKSDFARFKGYQTVTVEKDHAYGNKKMVYQAVPLVELFEGIPYDSFETMSFKCLDGFSGAISKIRTLNQDPNGSIAYLAIELENQKWPPLKPNKPDSAGPYYLIWMNPEKSKIMTEEWPYQLSGFELSKQSQDSLFSNTVPDKSIIESDPISHGHNLFMTNCFVCHSFNGDGVGKIGPDLNYPYSPSEYFQFNYFSMLVKNPQSLRSWNQARMPGFSDSLSDQDLKDIWLYFSHMAKRKRSK